MLNNTGHSIHAERPRFFAGEILLAGQQPARAIDLAFLAPLLLSEPAHAPPDLGFLVPLLLSELRQSLTDLLSYSSALVR